jgi:hypothetical protein
MKPIVVALSNLSAGLRRLREAGSAIFGSDDYTAAISRIRNSTIHTMPVAQ